MAYNKANKANQDDFYASLVGREYSIATLMEIHGVSRPTVIKWLKEAKLEPIVGTWPPRYTYGENQLSVETVKVKSTPKEIPMPEYTEKMLSSYLEHLLNKETELDIAKLFRSVSKASDSKALIKGLKDTLAVAIHYDSFFMEDGLI